MLESWLGKEDLLAPAPHTHGFWALKTSRDTSQKALSVRMRLAPSEGEACGEVSVPAASDNPGGLMWR